MRYSDIFVENAENYTYLYRGDSTMIPYFNIKKTDANALFGVGIYLTDNPEIAKDYTIKGSNEIVFQADGDQSFDSPKKLIQEYLVKLANASGFQEEAKELKQFYEAKIHNKHGYYDDEGKYQATPKNELEKFRKEMENEWNIARTKLVRKYVEMAKKIFKQNKQHLKITKLTTGEYVFVNTNRKAVISKFKVPNLYIAKTLHGDRPLDNRMIQVVKNIFARNFNGFSNDKKIDLRTTKSENSENYFNTFDDYIKDYKTHGSRYAWTDKIFGGKGENPSLDVFMNGTHSGYHVFKNNDQENIIKDFEAAGYVGIEYDGGVKLAGNGSRGGGNNLHRAFVFWDEEKINSFRVEEHPYQDDELGEIEKGLRWNTIPLRIA
jgi:hypothetical protein